MNKKTIITILLALVVMSGQGQVRCHVIGTVSDGTTPVELVIYRDGEAPKNSMLRPVLKDGTMRFNVEALQPELLPRMTDNLLPCTHSAPNFRNRNGKRLM